MISIRDKKDCCGCQSCAQRCPKQCISMHYDSEGFLYPKVEEDICVNCGLCEKVCPELKPNKVRKPIEVLAAKNADENVRRQSSSGGVFTVLAELVIQDGGVVFGARVGVDGTVYHDYVDTKENLALLRGSKYVQSDTRKAFKDVEVFLKQGRKVLYSGTPCQIAGLRCFLRKNYENLLTVDFICHGVPSPGVFKTYLRDEVAICTARQGGGKNTVLLPCIPLVTESDGLWENSVKIQSVSFRDKRNGWKKYGFALSFSEASAEGENSVLLSYSPLNENPFLLGFLRNLYLRPSCYVCQFKQLKSGSDITLGDFWGICSLMPDIDDDGGISAVTVNTEKGYAALHHTDVVLYSTTYEDLVQRNPALEHSVSVPENRAEFFRNDSRTFEEKIEILAKEKRPWFKRVVRAVYRYIMNVVIK